MVRRVFLTILTSAVLLLSIFSINYPRVLAEDTTLYVDPPHTFGVNVGDTVTINIAVSNVIDLSGWQFNLAYQNDVLNASELSEGPFLRQGGASTFFYPAEFTDNYNATHGLISVACAHMQITSGVDGSGILATITFKVKAALDTLLDLFNTKLINSTQPFGYPIPHTVVDGEIQAGFHDVAITNVNVSTNLVYKGQPVQVNTTVKNYGEYPETFNLTLRYDNYLIETQNISHLGAGSELTLNFIWDTSTAEPDRTYTMRTEATSVRGETNLDNNVFVDGTITVRSHPAFLIKILDVTPCNQSGYPASSFEVGSIGYFKATVNSTSFGPEIVLVAVNVYDSSNTTLGVVSFNGNIMPGISTFILGLPIPSSASHGLGKVYANAFTDWPYFGGIPYCPEVSAAFEIISP